MLREEIATNPGEERAPRSAALSSPSPSNKRDRDWASFMG